MNRQQREKSLQLYLYRDGDDPIRYHNLRHRHAPSAIDKDLDGKTVCAFRPRSSPSLCTTVYVFKTTQIQHFLALIKVVFDEDQGHVCMVR